MYMQPLLGKCFERILILVKHAAQPHYILREFLNPILRSTTQGAWYLHIDLQIWCVWEIETEFNL